MRILEETEEMIMDENTRKVIRKYLQAVKDFKIRGEESEMHKLCYHLAEEFLRVNVEERDFFFNAEEWKGHINSQIEEDNTSYCVTVDFESLTNSKDWRSIDICIDKTTMLITTVFGVNDWYQY